MFLYLPPNTTVSPSEEKSLAWFCLRSQPKHEHIVAAHLRETNRFQVFLPRIRFQRATRKGTVWVTEALFPGYLFVKFNWKISLRQVQHISGARGIVHFGNYWPVVPEETLAQLRQTIGTSELLTIAGGFSPGDVVHVADGPLQGLTAVVSRLLPGRQRVEVLMEILGRQTMIEVPSRSVVKEHDERAAIFQE